MQEPRIAPLTTGQGYLRSRLKTVHELELRRRTALRDWIAAVVAVGSQQFTPFGIKLPAVWFVALTGISFTAIFVSAFVYPRLRAPRFMRVEQVMMGLVWGGTALIVYASGGADSPYIFFYAQSMIYCAYFFARGRMALIHVAIGSVAAALPIFYDHQAAMASDFVPTIIVALAVWWMLCLVIAFRRRTVLKAEHRARRMAMTDALTHVANVRALKEYAEQLRVAAVGDAAFSIAIVDLDGLKTANTLHGHAGGDQLIRRLAHALRVASGEVDQVARVGGDEFVVLMPGSDAAQLELWRRRLSAAIAADNIANSHDGLKLKASVGTAVAPDDARKLDDLLDVADQRMYQQKTVSQYGVDDKLVGEMLKGGKKFDGTSDKSAKKPFIRLDHVSAPAGIIMAMIIAAATAGAIFFTGGSSSVFVSTVLIGVTYFAYFGRRRQAISGTGILLGAFAAAYFGTGPSTAVEQTRFTTIIFSAFVVGYALQTNGRKLVAAEEQARELSRIDALSNALNRRVFEEDLADVLDRADGEEVRRSGRGPVLLLIDIDDFKHVNTLLGHPGGDRLICDTARALNEAIGRHGSVYRVGGDEFAVLLPSVPECDAEPYADRCVRVIRAIQRHDEYSRHGVSVGASVGYAVRRSSVTAGELFAQADRSMMNAKQIAHEKRQGVPGRRDLPAIAC